MVTSVSPRTRWIQLSLGLVCMVVISSPQYVWALFTQPLTAGLGSTLPELQIIVPGHGPMGSGPEVISWLIDYLENLRDDVARLHSAGHFLEETVQPCPSPFADGLDPRLSNTLRGYPGPHAAIHAGYLSLCRNLHRLNVLANYRIIEAQTP